MRWAWGSGQYSGARCGMEMTPSLRGQWRWRVSRKALGGSLPANIMGYPLFVIFSMFFLNKQRPKEFSFLMVFPLAIYSGPLDPGMTARWPAAVSQMDPPMSSGWEHPPRLEGGAEGNPGSSCRHPAETARLFFATRQGAPH